MEVSFDKQKYWDNRKDGKRGQGVDITVAPAPAVPDSAVIGFSDDGKLIVKNRAFRRQRTKIHSKSSQLRKKGKRKKK